MVLSHSRIQNRTDSRKNANIPGAPIPVLHVVKSLGLGGTEKTAQLFATHLDRSRYAPAVHSPTDGERGPELRAAGIPTHIGKNIEDTLSRVNPTIIHVHRAGWPEPALMRPLVLYARTRRHVRIVETNVFGRYDPSPWGRRASGSCTTPWKRIFSRTAASRRKNGTFPDPSSGDCRARTPANGPLWLLIFSRNFAWPRLNFPIWWSGALTPRMNLCDATALKQTSVFLNPLRLKRSLPVFWTGFPYSRTRTIPEKVSACALRKPCAPGFRWSPTHARSPRTTHSSSWSNTAGRVWLPRPRGNTPRPFYGSSITRPRRDAWAGPPGKRPCRAMPRRLLRDSLRMCMMDFFKIQCKGTVHADDA